MGRAVAEFLAAQKWDVALVARNEQELHDVIAGIEMAGSRAVRVFVLDIGDAKQREVLLEYIRSSEGPNAAVRSTRTND